MRPRSVAFVMLCVIASSWPAGAQRLSPPLTRDERLGSVQVTLFMQQTVQRYDAHGSQGVEAHWEQATSGLVRGPNAVLPPIARGVRGVRERSARVCGVPARIREVVTRFEELTATNDDGTGEVYRTPGPVEITMTFDYAGEHYAVKWTVSDHRRRARYRTFERRFFASVRCSAAAPPAPPPTP